MKSADPVWKDSGLSFNTVSDFGAPVKTGKVL
jgi:hypothetical protein